MQQGQVPEQPPFGENEFYFDKAKIDKMSHGTKYKLEQWDQQMKLELQ